MPHQEKKQTEIITVLGQRGSGKSSWIQKALPDIPRFILWDTLGEYEGYAQAINKQELFDYVWDNEAGVLQVVYNTIDEDDFGFVCTVCENIGDLTFIVEEVDNYATPNLIPVELRRLLKYGRHVGLSMIFVSRRPAEINRLITSQSQRFICFTIIEPVDVRYLTSIIGPVAKVLPTLKKLEFVDWSPDRIKRGQIKW